MQVRTAIWLLLSVFGVMGCQLWKKPTHIVFTPEHRQNFSAKLAFIQYSISESVILKGKFVDRLKDADTNAHGIRIESKRELTRITIRKGTPGILRRVEGNTLYIQFEQLPDGKDRTIPFEKNCVLDEKQREKDCFYELNPPTVNYEGQKFRVYYVIKDVPVYEVKDNITVVDRYIEGSHYPVLLVRTKEIDDFIKEDRVARGILIKKGAKNH